MEKSGGSSCVEEKGRRPSTLLGLFLQPHSCVSNFPEIYGGSFTTRLLPTSSADGKLLGALDASLSFIGQKVYIKATSNGLLLCSLELNSPKHYCICNPITREWRILPKPNKTYQHVALAFSCERQETSLDQLHFTLAQATLKDTTSLVIETFSSDTGEWRESNITCASPFDLVVANCPALVVNNVFYWTCYGSRVVVYDPNKESLELIQAPEFCGDYVVYSEVWAKSEGRIYYARNSVAHFELWRLETNDGGRTTEWFRVARASLEDMLAKRFSRVPDGGKYNFVGVDGVHPYDSRRVLLGLKYTPVWYDVESGEIENLNDDSGNICGSVPWDYFMYECPSVI